MDAGGVNWGTLALVYAQNQLAQQEMAQKQATRALSSIESRP